MLSKIYRSILFVIFFVAKLIQSNIIIAWDIITPGKQANPGTFWVPVRLKSNFGLLLLCNLTSMTPGTLSIDYDKNKKILLVHHLYSNEKHNVEKDIEVMQSKIEMILN
jgi:multicomponent Na+:H+ antiporter subunit E